VNSVTKKLLLSVFITFFISSVVWAERLTFIVSGNYISIEDSTFEDAYGKNKYFPEGKLSFRFSGNFYLWGSFGYLSSKKTWKEWSNKGIPNADMDSISTTDKTIWSGGLGYYVGYLAPYNFSLKLELGVCSIKDSIEEKKTFIATDEVYSSEKGKKSAVGFRGNFGITYGLFKNIFAEASIGYMVAKDTFDDESINLGGLRLSLGLGIAL